MPRLTRKRILIGAVALMVLALLVWSFLPEPVPVQTATVSRGALAVIIEEEGRTEVVERFAITAPVAAFVRRIELEAGDAVTAGQAVAALEPPRTPVLAPAERAEAAARVRAAEAAAASAATERDRLARLVESDAATRQALDQAIAEAERADAELAAARAALRGTEGQANLPVADVLRSPVAGRVLTVRRRSEGNVLPGDTLLVIGDIDALEIRADVLSQDAVRIHPGTRVRLDQWGGEEELEAVVTRVEPQAFTTISSLGVEEQRVVVVASLAAPPGRLGAGYRVLARFVVWQGENVLQVPSAALFRVGDGWAAFVVEDGRARRRTVTIGQQAGLQTQVVDGLAEGEAVVVHPSNEIDDGVRVEAAGS